MFTQPRRFLTGLVLIALLGACNAAPPIPTATPPATATATALPPTATLVPTETALPPTATPEPAARISDLVLFGEPEMTTPQGDEAEFDFGQSALYAQLDYQGMPLQFGFTWTLTRREQKIVEGSLHPTESTGTLTFTVTPPNSLLPGDYRLAVRAFNQLSERPFKVVTDQASPGTVLLTEDFANNSNGWDLFSATYGTTKISDGQLLIKLLKQHSWVGGLLNLDLADLDLTTDVSFEGPRDSAAYIFFRAADGSGYQFNLSGNGYWMVNKVLSDDYEVMSDWQVAKSFSTQAANQVRIIATGDQMAFYLNDTLLGTLIDDEYQHGGIRLGAGSSAATGMTVSYDNLVIRTPQEALKITATTTPQPKPTARPKATQGPQPTSAPQSLPLADIVRRTLRQVESLGGALDRLYGGSLEACAPFVADYQGVVSAPQYDVATQPANVQGAYASYRQAVGLIGDKVSSIIEVCQKGGGAPSRLSLDVARMSINDAGSLLTGALNALQP